MKDRRIIWESTDRCCKQYRSGNAFLSTISTKFHVIVDHMIGTPGHGKDVIDGINACDKRYPIESVYD